MLRFFMLREDGTLDGPVGASAYQTWYDLHPELRSVARAVITPPNNGEGNRVDVIRVSTLFLGLDHSWRSEGPALVFETTIYGGEYDDSAWRWFTMADAQSGHQRIVDAIVAGEPPEPDTEPDSP